MTEEELFQLMALNGERYEKEVNTLREQHEKMTQFINDCLKSNSKHRHFRTKKMMKEAMLWDFNPFNTFSYGRKNPKEAVEEKT